MFDILLCSIFVYIILLTIIILIKPKIIYNHKINKYKEFGFNIKTETILPYPLLCSLMALISFSLTVIYFKFTD